MTVRRYDRGPLNSVQTLDSPSQTNAGGVRLQGYAARVGVQKYDLKDGSVRYELRLPEEVFSPESLKSYDGAWMTDNHPRDFVTTSTARAYSRGLVTAAGRQDGEMVAIDSVVDDQRLLDRLEAMKMQGKGAELSVGYDADLEMKAGVHPKFGRYDAIQRNIRVNHVAVVDSARAGRDARLRLDDSEEVLDEVDARVDAVLNAAARHALPARDFAVPDDEGLPIGDAVHVRAAMARFGQYQFKTSAAKHAAYGRIVAKAKELGVDSKGFETAWSGRLDTAPLKSGAQTMTKEEIEALQKALEAEKARAATLEADLHAARARADSAEGSVVALTGDVNQLRAQHIDTADFEALKAAIVKLTKERDDAIKQRTDATTPAALDKLVEKRTELVLETLAIDPAFDHRERSNRQIMDHALLKATGQASATSQSDDFVAGQFAKTIEGRRSWMQHLPRATARVDAREDDDQDAGSGVARTIPQSERWKKPLPNSKFAKES
jgi:hypothetical protein